MTRRTHRWLKWVAYVALERRRYVVAGLVVVLGLSLVVLPKLGVSTSRYGLVSEDNPYQRRLIGFFERFGYPDTPAIVVQGGTEHDRHAIVDRLAQELEQIESLRRRVSARMVPQDLAEVLLVQEPASLAQARAALAGDASLPEVIEGGLPAWTGALERQLYAGLEGETSASEEQTAQGLQTMTMMADALRVHLEGGDAMASLPLEAGFADRPGIDGRGYLATVDDQVLVVALYPDLPGDDVNEVFTPLVNDIRAVRDVVMANAPPGMTADVTGLPALAVDELALIKEGLMQTTLVAGLGILLLCLALFRSLHLTVLAVLPLVVGIILTLAATQLIYGDLNTVTSSFVAVLMGLGIDFAVHVVARANEQRRGGASQAEGARTALLETGAGIATGTVATAAAFLTTTTTEFTAYGELGVITAVGLGLMMLATFFLLPPLLASRRAGTFMAPEPPLPSQMPAFIRRFRKPLLGLGFLGALGGLAAAPAIEFDPRYFSFLPEDQESSTGLRALEYDPIMSPVFANVTAPSVEDARERTKQLRALDSVAGVQSGTDLLPPLTPERVGELQAGFAGLERDPDFGALSRRATQPDELAQAVGGVMDALDEVRFALEQGHRPSHPAVSAHAAFKSLRDVLERADEAVAGRLAAIEPAMADVLRRAWSTARRVAERGEYAPSDLPPLFRRRFASRDGREMAVYAVPSGKFWDAEVAARFVEDLERLDPSASGMAMNHHTHSVMIMKGFRDATGYAVGLIILVLLIDFRSVRDAALALTPTLMGWAWMLGIMAATDFDFDTANIVSLPLVLGIGVAFGVHMVHRCQESAAREGVASLDEVVRGTGGAIMVAALTTMVGFGALMLVDHKAMVSVGIAMVLGIASCLVASLLMLPALLVVFRRAH